MRSLRAFTLIEVMLALGVSAMVVMLISSALALSLKANTALTDTLSPLHQERVWLHQWRQDLQSMTRPNGILAETFEVEPVNHSSGLMGTEVRMSVRTKWASPGQGNVISDADMELGYARVIWRTEEDPASPGTLRVVREYQPHLLAVTEPTPLREVMLTGVEEWVLWLDEGDGADLMFWDSLDEDDSLPYAVECEVSWPESDGGDVRVYRVGLYSALWDIIQNEGEESGP